MPTGFTSDVADGKVTDLRSFAMMCARGMGALITMRDDSRDAPIPTSFEPNFAYYGDALAKAEADLAEASDLTDAECEARAEADYKKAVADRAGYSAERRAKAERYRAMIAKVEAWTCDAEGLREFMLSRLHESLKFDCGDEGDLNPRYWPIPVRQTGVEWRRATIEKATKDVGRFSEECAKERARTAERNRWLKALHDSLPGKGEGQ
jgi:hypothetical protein